MKTLLVILFGAMVTAGLAGFDTAYANQSSRSTAKVAPMKKGIHHKAKKGKTHKVAAKVKKESREPMYELPHL